MKIPSLYAFIAAVSAADFGPGYGGTGPYKTYYFEVEGLTNHTFYQPLQSGLGSDLKLPVIIWGNGGCYPWFFTVGSAFRAFLSEVTSHGALAIAIGAVFTDPLTYVLTPAPGMPGSIQNPSALTVAVDWVYANAGKGSWKHIDKTRIGVWGQSCGGLEAYTAGLNDKRIGHIGIFNSGQLNATTSEEVAGKVEKPIFYLLGGPDDVAYPNGERDYADLPQGTPSWKANHNLGHTGGFEGPNGGLAGVVGSRMVQWILRGDAKARAWFTGEGPYSIGIKNVTYKILDRIRVMPIQ